MRLIRFALFACFLLLHIVEVTTTYLSTTTTKPSTTRRPYTSGIHDECFPPCKLVKVTDAYGQSKSVCKCTTTPTTTTPNITKTPNVTKTSTKPTSASETPSTTKTTTKLAPDCLPPCTEGQVTDSYGLLTKTCECTTTSPPITTTPKCPDLSTSCDMYPCRPIKTNRYDYNGCPVYECFCEDSTTPPSSTICPQIAIDCLPGCVPFSTIAPGELCPDYRCECTTTTEDTTQTHSTTSPSTKVTIQCGTPRVTCPSIKGCVIKSTNGYDGCPKYDCECTTTTQTPTTTSPSTSVTKECLIPPIMCPYNEGCVIKSTTGDDGCPYPYCECTTTTDEPTQTPTTTSPSTSVTKVCTTPPIRCPYNEGCVIKSTTGDDGCPYLYCECTTTTETPTTTSPSTTVTTECPQPKVTCPEYEDCVIKSTTGADGCPDAYCECNDVTTEITSTESTSTFETPSTTITTRVTTPCRPPISITCPYEHCVKKSENGTDGCPQYYCDCRVVTTATTTESTSTYETPSTTITTRVTTGRCPPPRKITCPYEDCDIKSENGYDGCPQNYCVCRNVTTATTTAATTRITTSPQCYKGYLRCDAYGRRCDQIVYMGADSLGCPRYRCICSTTTETTRTTTPDITTTPEETTAPQCYADPAAGCDGYTRPCDEIVYMGLNSFGCHYYECICYTSPEPTTTSPEPTTTSPEPTTTSPEPTTTSPEPTTTSPEPTTTSPEETTAPPCYYDPPGCDGYTRPCDEIVYMGLNRYGCPYYECICYTTTETTTTSPEPTTTSPCHAESPSCEGGPCAEIVFVGFDNYGCPQYRCNNCSTTTEKTTPDVTTTPLVTCPASVITCSPGCVLNSRPGPDGCPAYECSCTTASTQITTTTCPELVDDCRMLYSCLSVPIYYYGCITHYHCICSTVATTSPCSEPLCPEGCRYVPRTYDVCPWCDCSNLTTTTTPPEPTTTPPRPTTKPPRPTTKPPRPTTKPPRPTTKPPRPTTKPPRPTTKPPRPTTKPPRPTTKTPRPTTKPPRPTTKPPRPNTKPPRPTTKTPRPTTKPLRPTTKPPRTTTPTSTRCPAVTCPRRCRYVTLPNGCKGCNCTPTTTPSTTVTTTTPEDHCDDPCERVMGQDGCNPCQCPKTCDDIECESFEECVMQEVFCKRAPCFPVPTCVKRCDSCLAKPAKEKCGGILQHRWTYDSTSKTCKKFSYYGCIPSPNTYKTRQQCVNECKSKTPFCTPCGPKCYTLRRPGGCPKCICPNPCTKFKCPKRKTCKLREMECFREPCPQPRPYCA